MEGEVQHKLKKEKKKMAPEATTKKKAGGNKTAGVKASRKGTMITESLLITDAEKHGTSQSMYGDSSARISSNVSSIHDRVRHRAYDVLLRSVKGKRILHLGCGMGLYGMLMAKAQAAHVVAIDHSAVVEAAREVAKMNKLENITFLRGYLRDVLKQLPESEKKYDVVVCEWMGTFLLNERVLADVLYARDNLLSPKGSVCPNQSSLHICGVSDYQFRMDTEDFWSNVYGFNMDPMKALVRQEVEVCAIPSTNIVTSTCRMHTIQLDALPGLTAEELSTYLAASKIAEDDRLLAKRNPILDKWSSLETAVKGFTCEFDIVASSRCTIHYLTFYVDAAYYTETDPGANFILPVNPGGANPWTEASIGLLEPLPVEIGEHVRGTFRAYTPNTKDGKVTVVEITARTEGKVANIETTGKYCYQSY